MAIHACVVLFVLDRYVSPYSELQFTLMNHFRIGKERQLGEGRLKIYPLLAQYGGRCEYAQRNNCAKCRTHRNFDFRFIRIYFISDRILTNLKLILCTTVMPNLYIYK